MTVTSTTTSATTSKSSPRCCSSSPTQNFRLRQKSDSTLETIFHFGRKFWIVKLLRFSFLVSSAAAAAFFVCKIFFSLSRGFHRQRRRRRRRRRLLLSKVGTRFGLTCPCSLRLQWRNLLSVSLQSYEEPESLDSSLGPQPGPFLLLPPPTLLAFKAVEFSQRTTFWEHRKLGGRRKNFPHRQLFPFLFLSTSVGGGNFRPRCRRSSRLAQPSFAPRNAVQKTFGRSVRGDSVGDENLPQSQKCEKVAEKLKKNFSLKKETL